MKKLWIGAAMGMLCGMVMATAAQAGGEIDVLLDKLVEKDIITPLEAQIIQDETKQAVTEDMSAGKSYSMPDWVQNMKLKGDLRLRYQYQRQKNDTEDRERGRIRYRLGLESKVNNQLKVGAGLASGGEDPRSTNQTLQDTFETGDIRLDYAYAEYMPQWSVFDNLDDIKTVAGIFKPDDYLWTPTDMLWDGDIRPGGVSVHTEKSLGELDGFFNFGAWVMDENNKLDRSAPWMSYIQGGGKFAEGPLDAKAALTYYAFSGVKGACLDYTAGTNTTVNGGTCSSGNGLKYDYDAFGASAELGLNEIFGGLPLSIDERIAVFTDFVKNNDPSEQDTGFALGGVVGNKKIKDLGQWQLKYIFARLERDAWLDTFPDSDRLDGATNVKSHEAIFQIGLMKNVKFGIDYYQSDALKGAKNKQHLVQGDVEIKF